MTYSMDSRMKPETPSGCWAWTSRRWGVGDAEEAHCELAAENPIDRPAPQVGADPFPVEAALFLDISGGEQVGNAGGQLGAMPEPGAEAPGHQAGQAVVVEAALLAGEPVGALVPELAGEIGQLGAQFFLVNEGKALVIAVAEEGEEVVEIQAADGRQFQFEQGVLAWVGIHGVDAPGPGQGVIEDVAAGAGDDQHGVVRGEIEGLAIHRRIFPAGVVDQGAGVDGVEDALVDAVEESGVAFDHGRDSFRSPLP